jgi:hypothetical protein
MEPRWGAPPASRRRCSLRHRPCAPRSSDRPAPAVCARYIPGDVDWQNRKARHGYSARAVPVWQTLHELVAKVSRFSGVTGHSRLPLSRVESSLIARCTSSKATKISCGFMASPGRSASPAVSPPRSLISVAGRESHANLSFRAVLAVDGDRKVRIVIGAAAAGRILSPQWRAPPAAPARRNGRRAA